MTYLLACPVAHAAPPVLEQSERQALSGAVADALDAQYIDPAMAQRMRKVLPRNAARGDDVAIADPAALAQRLTDDLRAVSHDGHQWMEYHPEGARWAGLSQSHRARCGAACDGARQRRLRQGRTDAGQRRLPHVPRLRLPVPCASTARSAMDFVANTHVLIIDLRDNAGGDPAMVAYLASYLFDERVRLNDIYTRKSNSIAHSWATPGLPGPAFGGRKPLYLLTTPQTFSAAGDFAYALQKTGRAAAVGDASGGGAHPSRGFKVSAHFVAVVPYAKSVSAITHANWEGTGVLPDVAVPASQALDTAYRLGIERLIATSANADEVARLRAFAATAPDLLLRACCP
ncbi:S41 family peptidase [Xanthomonas oryzae]|uniref:S41 family peptidase n=1 Tax=Xanthomonas oryzae TaxID=347 RepID=UPI001FB749E2|nr:S41 family peptidase [Xanthomonas oryzae]